MPIHSSKIIMSHEVFDALPRSADDATRNAFCKVLTDGNWYVVDPQGSLQRIEVRAGRYVSEE